MLGDHPNPRTLGGLALSAGALVLGFPPFSIPVVPFVGLVPLLLFLDRTRRNRDVVLGSLAFSIPYYLGTMGWLFLLYRFTPAGAIGAFIAFLLHLGTFALFPAGLIVLRRTGHVPLWLAAPVLWAIGEHARTFGDLDFEWVTLGSALSDWPLLIQHADLVGIWGLSFWIASINACAATALSPRRTNRARLWATGGILLALAAPAAYGIYRTGSLRKELADAPHLRVAIVQPNIPQRLKWSASAREANLAAMNRLVRVAESGDPDLVVAPEACLPLIVALDASRLPGSVEPGQAPLLLGLVRGVGDRVAVEEGGVKGYRYARHRNSAVLASPDRTILDAHDKTTLVPMTEAIPFSRVFGFILPFMRQQFGRFEAGGPARPIPVNARETGVDLGALICFEVLHPSEVRGLVNRGADVLVNITNDAWFGRSNMPWHHLGVAVVRAIETRRSVVRSANTGISALVDPLGNVTSRTGLFEEAVLRGEVPVFHARSVYSRVGDAVLWFAYGGTAFFLGAALVSYWRSP